MRVGITTTCMFRLEEAWMAPRALPLVPLLMTLLALPGAGGPRGEGKEPDGPPLLRQPPLSKVGLPAAALQPPPTVLKRC